MFDNLREDAASNSFEEEATFQPAAGTSSYDGEPATASRFLGMTAAQRFVLAVMLLFTVCVIGAMFLLVMGKIAI